MIYLGNDWYLDTDDFNSYVLKEDSGKVNMQGMMAFKNISFHKQLSRALMRYRNLMVMRNITNKKLDEIINEINSQDEKMLDTIEYFEKQIDKKLKQLNK